MYIDNMAIALDITDKKFGLLTGVKKLPSLGRYACWQFKCDCGNLVESKLRNVTKGKKTNCGCVKEIRKNNIEGKKFGKLTAVAVTGIKIGRNWAWLCQCDCGKVCYIPRTWLTSGNNTSCGCGHKDRLEKAWAANRKEFKISETKEYKLAHQKKMRENPVNKLHSNFSANLKNALRGCNVTKKNPTFKMLGYSREDLIKHIEKQFLSGMTWENIGKWHIDHIVPISLAQTEQDIIDLNQLSNLRPLWAKDNLSKHNKRLFLI